MFNRLAHFLIPQESNNYRAKILHNRSIALFSILFLIFQLFLSSIILLKPKVLGYTSQISPNKVIELTNLERTRAGFPILTENPQLSEAAREKAGDMFAFNYWAHVSPTGKEPWAFFKQVGYSYVYAGENLARDFTTPENTVTAWMASPSHKENLLNPRYKEIGIAVVDGTLLGSDTTLVVQLFGTRQGQSYTEKKPVIPQAAVSQEEKPPEIPLMENKPVLAQSKGSEIPIINPFTLTQIMGFTALTILLVLFIVDGSLIWKKGVIRLTGRSLAHALFLLGIVMIIILSERGVII